MSNYLVEQYVPVVGWVVVGAQPTEEAALSFATRRQAVIHLAKAPEGELRVRHRLERPMTLSPRDRVGVC